MKTRPQISPVAAWIVFCVFCNVTGWFLSALHQLNTLGYGFCFGLGFLVFAVWKWKTDAVFCTRQDFYKLQRRFRRFLPFAFLTLSTLAFLGGLLHAPSNYDALSYREPRVLHWLTEGRWHWIHTDYARLNVRAVGFEWLSAPLFALTKTDRLVFLLNVISFLLLPGLVFSVFHRLGVRRRVAWSWAWIAPTGYCFLLQAGSIGNDMFSAVFALAAIDFALRAKESQNGRDFWLSVLSAALLTGAKTSNLPLLLPWLIALAPSLKVLARRPIASMAVCIAAALSSFAPIAIANWYQCGDWSGEPLEQLRRADPLFRIPVNTVLLLHQNFTPPVFPIAQWWNRVAPAHIPPSLKAKLENGFEPGGVHLVMSELETEEQAGLGFGVSVLLLASLAAAISCRSSRTVHISRLQWAIIGSTWFCLVVVMSKFGLTAIGRIIAPYYFLLIPAFLLSESHEQIVRSKWWQLCTRGLFLIAAFLVVVSPARPLWPANFVMKKLDANNSHNPKLHRIGQVFATYAERPDAFAPVRAKLPPELSLLGLVSADDPETSLWRPFGSRRIEDVKQNDLLENLRERGIQYVLVNSHVLSKPVTEWTEEMHGEVLWKMMLQLKSSQPPIDWYLVRVDSVPSHARSVARNANPALTHEAD